MKTKRHIGTGTVKFNDRARELLGQIMDTERVSFGPLSVALEEQFAKLHQRDYALLSNSGTDALRIALHTLKSLHGWQDGDEVIVPATTFIATANIVRQLNLSPIFVDVYPDTFNISVEATERAITPRTRAVIPVHLLGQPANVPGIRELSRNFLVVEDSCEAMLCEWDGQRVGSLGEIGCFSLYVAHIVTAGVGGICTTNNEDYAIKIRSLINHALTPENLNLVGKSIIPLPAVGRRFQFDDMGYSARLTEFEAALALSQLEDDPVYDLIRPRRRNADHLEAGIKIINTHYAEGGRWLYTQQTDARATHSRMMFPFVIDLHAPDWLTKPALTAWLNEAGVETRDIPSLLDQPAYAINPADFPVSAELLEKGFYVGCHQDLNSDDIQYVLDTIYEFVDNHRRIT